MNFKHMSLLMAALAGLTLGGCKKPAEEQTPTPTPSQEVEGAVTITTGPLETAVAASGGTVSIAFTTNKEWTAETNASWLHLSAASGNTGKNTVTVTVDKNETLDGRSATVSVTCGTDTKRVTVNQLQKDVLVLNGSDITVKAEGETVNITLSANVEVTAQADVDWITVAATKGLTECTFAITVDANETYDARTGHVTFSSVAGNGSITIDQVQKDAMILAPQTIEIKAEGGELELIKLQANVEVNAQADVDWLSVEEAVETKGLVELAYIITVAANETTETRTGHVVFASDAGSQTITVNQAAKADDPGENPVEDPFNGELPMLTETTTWAGEVFDAIINTNAGAEATEWTSPDAENFIDAKLGYLAGKTESVDETTGETKVTNGKFKFKKNENAGIGKMSRVQFGGTGVMGIRNNLIFKVDGPGTVTVIGRSSGEAARKLGVALNGSPLAEEGYVMPDKSQNASTVSVKVEAEEGDLIYVYSLESGINVYSLKWTPAGESGDPGDNPGGDPTPAGENDDLACPTPPTVGTVDPTALVGYGAGVTGGEGSGGNVLHFNSGKALQTWLLQRTKDEKKGNHTPTVIWLSGTFKSDEGRDFSEAHPWFDVKDVSNLSFIGTDDFVMDKIGIFCVRAKNIIIRNINFQQPKANNGADAVSMQECDGVWVDHCTFTSLNQTKDYEDGSTDITHGSKNVTVSWCRYIKTQKSCLVGHSNSQSGDVAITATFHHNWFEGSSSRHPRVRFGTVHVYNNLFDGNTTYGVGSAYGAKVLVEYNYFDAVQLPTDICTYPAKDNNNSNLEGSVAGYLYPTQNMYVNKPAKAKSPYPLSNVKYTKYGGTAGTELTYADFKPAYSYTVTATEDVPALVKANAGYGKLDGFASAPVPVDNGGISDYNGSDDDPVNPDPGTGDDPGDEPGDDPGDEPGTPGTHTLYVGADKKIVGDTYFTNSESIADFSKDYSGSFTIDGTTYSYGLKMDSKGSVVFTTSSTLNTTVQFYFARRKADGTAKMQIIPDGGTAQEFETPHETYADSGVLALEKGTKYTIKQKSGEQALILVKVIESE